MSPRFSLTHYHLPKNAQGKTFFDKGSGYGRLRRAFQQTVEDRTLGVLSAEPRVGKTTAIRNLIGELPRPDYQVSYLCNTSGSPLDFYRGIAAEIGVRPLHRRGELWGDIKKTVGHMADEKGVVAVIVLDEAHRLSDSFLADLAGFLNFAFDSRDMMPLWLVGQPPLLKRLHQQKHDAPGRVSPLRCAWRRSSGRLSARLAEEPPQLKLGEIEPLHSYFRAGGTGEGGDGGNYRLALVTTRLQSINALDVVAMHWIAQRRHPALTRAMRWVTHTGEARTWFIAALVFNVLRTLGRPIDTLFLRAFFRSAPRPLLALRSKRDRAARRGGWRWRAPRLR